MGNLFLKEKEKWRLWLMLGILGAIASFAILQVTPTEESLSYKLLVSAAPSFVLGLLICWWMQFTRRFEYWRAFKVLTVVVLVASVPVLMLASISFEFNSAVSLLPILGHILLVSTIAMLGAWVAKRPKQYY